jgi:hypothetical protein
MRRSRVVRQIRIAAPTRRYAWCPSGSRSRRSAGRGATGRAGRGSLCFSPDRPLRQVRRHRLRANDDGAPERRRPLTRRWPMRAMGPEPDARRGGGPSRVSIPSTRTRGPGSSSPRTAAPCDRGTRACPLDDERSKDRGSGLGLGQPVGEWPQADRLVQAGDNRRCGAEGSGSSDRSRSVQIRSPTTALEAQFFVDRGGRKSSGFTNSHADETTSGINERRPIHFLLQIEPASIGRTAKRVQTLAGFEWRIQLSPLEPGRAGDRLAEVDPTFLTGHLPPFRGRFLPTSKRPRPPIGARLANAPALRLGCPRP